MARRNFQLQVTGENVGAITTEINAAIQGAWQNLNTGAYSNHTNAAKSVQTNRTKARMLQTNEAQQIL